MMHLPYMNPNHRHSKAYPDFEAIHEAGVDAVYLTQQGERETRFNDPSLYGWDCECVLVMNSEAINRAI